jgi:hypothetical protein
MTEMSRDVANPALSARSVEEVADALEELRKWVVADADDAKLAISWVSAPAAAEPRSVVHVPESGSHY